MKAVSVFDKSVAGAITRLPESSAPFMNRLSLIGEPLVVLTVGAAGFVSASARGKSDERTAFILGFVAFGIGIILKLLLRRRRPHGHVVRNFGINSYSFPSGHAFGTVIFYGLYAVIDTKYLSSPWDALFIALVAILIFFIGVSRVYKGIHYPSDVIAGWLVGAISLALINRLAF